MFLKNFIKKIDDTIGINNTIQDALDKMNQNKIHHIVIVEDKKAIGIITEKDIIDIYKNNVPFDNLAIDYAKKDLITLHNTRLIQYAINVMIDNSIRKVIVVDSNDNFAGCIEQEEIIYRFEEELDVANKTVREFSSESNIANIIPHTSSLESALDMMVSNNVRSLLISKENIPVGIISESDIVKLAYKRADQKKNLGSFIKSSLITIDMDESIHNMINLMKTKHIRRVVIKDTQDDKYHIINSKDVMSNLKGNYTKFLESKLFDTRDTLNAISEYIIELIDLNGEQVIFWTNYITKDKFNIQIDDNINKIIPKQLWDRLFKELLDDRIVSQVINIGDDYFKIKGHYGSVLDDNIIKLFLYDVTDITNLNQQLKKQNQIQEKILFEQQKLVQMGQMFGDIAHQFRQPLDTIGVAASGMQIKKEHGILDDEEFDNLTSNIITNMNYLSKTMYTFKNFMQEKKELKTFILQDRIKQVINIVSTMLKNNQIKLIDNIDYNQKTEVSLIVGELDQVLINIINNAKDLLVKNSIKIPTIKLSLKIGDEIVISLDDNSGVKDKNEFIEDFALHMSYKIVNESLDGKISIENIDNGTRFNITIPFINGSKDE